MKFKRLISALLAVMMMVGLVPLSEVKVKAAATDDYTQWKQYDAEWNQAPAWTKSEYPQATLFYMREGGCLVTSVAMLLRHYNVVTDTNVNKFNPWICNEALKKAKAYNSAADLVFKDVEKAYPGMKYVGATSYSLTNLKDLYNKGYACIIKVNGSGGYDHYVAVQSINESKVIIMDPGSAKTELSGYTAYTIYYYSMSSNSSGNVTPPATSEPDSGLKYKDALLNVDMNLISKVGHQTSGSESCGCYAIAYARTITDKSVHSFSEYNLYGNSQNPASAVWANGDYYGTGYKDKNQALTFLYEEIKNGRPVIAQVSGTRSTQHFVTIVGFENVTSLDELSEQNFLIIDPVPSSQYKIENMAEVGYSVKYYNDGSPNHYFIVRPMNSVPVVGFTSVTEMEDTTEQTTVKLYGPNGDVWNTIECEADSYVTMPSDYPKVDGSYFSGWTYTKDSSIVEVLPDYTIHVAYSYELYPVYVTHEQVVSGNEVLIYNIDDFNSSGYKVTQTGTQVLFNCKPLQFWTLWTDYDPEEVVESESVEVRTATIYRYYYFLCPNCGAHEPYSGTSDCGAKIPSSAWHQVWSTIPYSQSNPQGFSYTNAKYYTTSLGDDQMWIFSSGNLNDTKPGTQGTDTSSVVITVGYSSRTYVDSYEGVFEMVPLYTVTVEAHVHNYTTADAAPTCTEQGYTTHTCSCGDSYKDTYTDALGHNYVNGNCTRCGSEQPNSATATIVAGQATASSGSVVTFTVKVANCVKTTSMGIIVAFDPNVFEHAVDGSGAILGEWLLTGGMLADYSEGVAVIAFLNPVEVNGDVFTFQLKVKDGVLFAMSSVNAMVVIDNATPLTVVPTSVKIVCGHKNTTTVPTVPADCYNSGMTHGEWCNDCETYVIAPEEIPALGHTYYAYQVSQEPTPSVSGTLTGYCIRCMIQTTVTLPKLSTNDYHYSVVQAPTCTANGSGRYTWKETAYGDFSFDVSVSALGHDLVQNPAKASTCTEIGWNAHEACSRCDYSTREEIPMKDHTYSSTIIPPTTETEGYTLHTCTACGDSYKDNFVDKLQKGDVNGSEQVDSADAIHLLRHTLFPGIFQLNQSGDFNGDGSVDSADAIHLLRHTLFPSMYPLKSANAD